jgi:dihydroorotase
MIQINNKLYKYKFMNLLVKGITITDPNSEFNKKTCDLRVEQGKIVAIAKKIGSR